MGQTILVADDEVEVRNYLDLALRCRGYSVRTASDGVEVLTCLADPHEDVALVLMDVLMPRKDGLGTLREIRSVRPTLPVILISGMASPPVVIDAMKSGATDFLIKPITHDDLFKAVQSATGGIGISPGPNSGLARPQAEDVTPFCGNPQMQSLRAELKRVAASDVPVILQGESGVGKEVLARELHSQSPRANGPFLKLNCAAVPSELLESELFGYERGAYTGAFKSTPGKFEAADSGTMLLDEIGDMDLKLQAKLLHVLQDNEFQRLGGRETVRVDVRVLAATHCDLEKAIAEGRFRQDLYYRLNVITLFVPPLRERKDEILPLARVFLKKYSVPGQKVPDISPALRYALLSYNWPGNVRELENVIRKFLVLGDPAPIAQELKEKVVRTVPTLSSFKSTGENAVAEGDESKSVLEKVSDAKNEAEAQAILAALGATHWNRKKAAAMLNVEYKGLLYRMKKLGIDNEKHALPDKFSVAAVGSASKLASSGNGH